MVLNIQFINIIMMILFYQGIQSMILSGLNTSIYCIKNNLEYFHSLLNTILMDKRFVLHKQLIQVFNLILLLYEHCNVYFDWLIFNMYFSNFTSLIDVVICLFLQFLNI